MEQVQLPQNKISWSDAYLTAELNQEPFTEMRVVTVKSEVKMKVLDMAMTELLDRHVEITQDLIEYKIDKLLLSKIVAGYEFAEIHEDSVQVCINADSIDDETVWKSLDMVYLAVENGGQWMSDRKYFFTRPELNITNSDFMKVSLNNL